MEDAPNAWSLLKQLLTVAGGLWSGSSTSDICLITYFRVQFPQSKMTYVIQCHVCKNGHTRICLVRNPPTHGLASVAYHITNKGPRSCSTQIHHCFYCVSTQLQGCCMTFLWEMHTKADSIYKEWDRTQEPCHASELGEIMSSWESVTRTWIRITEWVMFRCLHQLKNPTPSMDDKSWMRYKETPPQVNHPSLMP